MWRELLKLSGFFLPFCKNLYILCLEKIYIKLINIGRYPDIIYSESIFKRNKTTPVPVVRRTLFLILSEFLIMLVCYH